VAALVNGETISREDLAVECLRHYGKQVLESVCNKYLIILECQRQNVSVSQEEVNAEIERMAKRFKLSVDQWLKMLKQERGINARQYANDIIWPTLALRKLAGERLAVTPEELRMEFEALYGPAVKGRIIVCNSLQKAQRTRADVAARPADFGNLAKERSDDPSSASLKGLIQPIRMHSGNREIEQVAFQMKDGEISDVIPIAGQYVIFQRESLIPARDVSPKEVQPHLEELVRERKLRGVANDIFRELQKHAKVENVMNDPQLSRAMPGVAARINGNAVTIRELAERCIERHGEEVLEGTINRRLIEQVVKKRNLVITEADLDQEIRRAAATTIRPKPDGSPDVEGWIKLVTEQQGITLEVYRHDAVWPSVALRKLAAERVRITEEDLKKGFEANYGPRVRCRVIVFDNLKRAQNVWETLDRAKKNGQLTADFFGDLAARHSAEATSRSLRGEVPPIQKHGGQPLVEKEAFELRPGEISGIIQLQGERYVILFCEGRTVPATVEFASVRDILLQDIQEKKLRLAMADIFQQLQDNATIDNFVAGTSHVPKSAEKKASSQAVAPRQQPTVR
jgi:parvulin-like peptidyl-prolyl isomerase